MTLERVGSYSDYFTIHCGIPVVDTHCTVEASWLQTFATSTLLPVKLSFQL